MERIKYDSNLIKIMSIFEAATRAKLKDAVSNDEMILFVVDENQIGKAVGKQGINVRKLENAFKRKIKIVEFNSDVLRFVQNFIYPLRAREVSENEGTIVIVGADMKTRGLIIGRDAKNLNFMKDVVKRYFSIIDIRVS